MSLEHQLDTDDPTMSAAGPEPSGQPAPAVSFDAGSLAALRRQVLVHAAALDFAPQRCADVALVVSELATNSIVHGGGRGTLRTWNEGDRIVHEIRDSGYIADPSAGTRLPPPDNRSGRGLWLVDHLSDRVQRHSSRAGTTTRVTFGREPRQAR